MFDLIIPCIFSHFKNINLTLQSFNHLNLVNNIIIILNDIQSRNINIESLKDFSSKLLIIKFNNKINPGLARQEGIKNSKSDYIIFHDADDIAHPDKILILKNCFEKYNCDHILHLIQPIDFNFIPYDLNNIKIINTNSILKYYNKKNNMDFGNIISKRISHGLSAVKKNKIININWVDKSSGEDKDFNLKSLLSGNQIIIVDCFLSSYDRYKTKMLKKYHKKAWEELKDYIK